MGIKQLYNDTLRKLPNEYGDVSVMVGWPVWIYSILTQICRFFIDVFALQGNVSTVFKKRLLSDVLNWSDIVILSKLCILQEECLTGWKMK